MGGKIAGILLALLLVVFVGVALISGKNGSNPPLVPTPQSDILPEREPAIIPPKAEPTPEEKLAYVPKGTLTVPVPVAPPQAAPVPGVTDRVSPPPPADTWPT